MDGLNGRVASLLARPLRMAYGHSRYVKDGCHQATDLTRLRVRRRRRCIRPAADTEAREARPMRMTRASLGMARAEDLWSPLSPGRC